MRLDDTLIKILNTIKLEVKEKFDKDYDIEELHDVVQTQIEATKLGISRGIVVHWARFCKFVYTKKVENLQTVNRFAEKVARNEELSSQEKEELIKQKIIDVSIAKKKRISDASKKSDRLQNPISSVDDIISTPMISPVHSKLFINITKLQK